MKRFSEFAFIALVLSILLAGCCTFGIDCPTSLPTATILAATSVGGNISAWVGATVEATAVPDTPSGFACTPNTSGCRLNMTGTTDSNGYYRVESNAVPGHWIIAIEPDATCSDGASQALFLGVSTEATAQVITCGNISPGDFLPSPSNCTQTINNGTGQITTNCPSTITLTSSTAMLPTGYALDLANYDNTGTELYSYTGSATSTTTITIPLTKLTTGDNVLIITDPTTNQVIGAALFTLNVTVYNPCGNKKTC